MKSLVLPAIALLLLAIFIYYHWQHYVPLLPERVVAHIDSSGRVNQWIDKTSFVNGTRLFFAIVPVALSGLAALSYLGVRYLPRALVNVPNKDYWLSSPEHRRQAGLLVVRFFLWFIFGFVGLIYVGVVTSMFAATMHRDANSSYLDISVVLLGMFFIFIQVGLLIFRLFYPPPK